MKQERDDYNHIGPAVMGGGAGALIGAELIALYAKHIDHDHYEAIEPQVMADHQQLKTDKGYVKFDSYHLPIPFFGNAQRIDLANFRQAVGQDHQTLTTEIGIQSHNPNVSKVADAIGLGLPIVIGSLVAVVLKRRRLNR